VIKIKKVITALLSEQINNELQKDDNIEVLAEDFLYQDAVLEYIEENEEIDFLLINEELPGEEIESFINKIKNIKIIFHSHNSSGNHKLFQRGMSILVNRIVDKRLACSSKASKWMYGNNKSIIIYNGVEALRFAYNEVVRSNLFYKYQIDKKIERTFARRTCYQVKCG